MIDISASNGRQVGVASERMVEGRRESQQFGFGLVTLKVSLYRVRSTSSL